jgi:uncharacterized protein involved in exopolysaccharide biosynthesis
MIPQPASEIPVEASIAFIVRRWPVILGAGLVAAAAGVIVATMQPVIFEGVATVAVVQPRFTADAKPISVGNFTALLQTNALAASAIAQLHLDADPFRMTPGQLQRDAVIVEEVRNSNLIRVRGRLPDRKLAPELANLISTNGIMLTERMDLQETKDFRSQLRAQLDEAGARLHAAEQSLLDHRNVAQVDLMKRDADSALTERSEILPLILDIESEKAKLASAEREIQKQDRLLTVPRMVGADAALLSARGEEKGAPKADGRRDAKPDSAERKDSPPRPRDSDAEPRISDIDLTNPFVNPVYQVLDYQIALSRTRLAGLEQRRRELVGVQRLGGKDLQALSALYPQEIKLRRLEGEHELAKTLYSEVALQYERTRLQIASTSARLQVVDRAIEPDAPLPRHRGLYGVLGLLGGIVAATFVVGLREIGRR